MATTIPKTTSSSRRQTIILTFTSPRDRLTYLWLALAIVLLPFATPISSPLRASMKEAMSC
jgi:hypothetical protein